MPLLATVVVHREVQNQTHGTWRKMTLNSTICGVKHLRLHQDPAKAESISPANAGALTSEHVIVPHACAFPERSSLSPALSDHRQLRKRAEPTISSSFLRALPVTPHLPTRFKGKEPGLSERNVNWEYMDSSRRVVRWGKHLGGCQLLNRVFRVVFKEMIFEQTPEAFEEVGHRSREGIWGG